MSPIKYLCKFRKGQYMSLRCEVFQCDCTKCKYCNDLELRIKEEADKIKKELEDNKED